MVQLLQTLNLPQSIYGNGFIKVELLY